MDANEFVTHGGHYSIIGENEVAVIAAEQSDVEVLLAQTVEFDSISYVVAQVGKHAFKRSAVSDVYLPEGITALGTQCFCYTPIKNMVLPNSVDSIASFAFFGSKIERIKTGDNLTVIGRLSFADCDNLKEVYLGSGVTMIDSYSFNNCSSLEAIYINALTPPEVGFYAFADTDISFCDLYVPAEAVEAYRDEELWSCFNIIPVYEVHNFVEYDYDYMMADN